jgi:hypothetical protein
VRLIYRFRKADWQWTVLESTGQVHVSNDSSSIVVSKRPTHLSRAILDGATFFHRQEKLLDSFLEHKTKNERLLAWRAELLNEEQTGEAAEGQRWNEKDSDSSTMLLRDAAMWPMNGSVRLPR